MQFTGLKSRVYLGIPLIERVLATQYSGPEARRGYWAGFVGCRRSARGLL
jgi:hypothetical protein